MAQTTSDAGHRTSRLFDTYTRDLSRGDFQRLFTHDARDAYQFYARGIDRRELDALPWHRRIPALIRRLFVAFTLKLSPARRIVYIVALALAVLGLLELFEGLRTVRVPAGALTVPMLLPAWRDGTTMLLAAFVLVNLLVLLELADRLSLKNDLEIARDIQAAMLPHETYRAEGVEVHGQTRPANTVGGDFYDIVPLTDGRVLVALGDVAGKGSPAALLMALLLAMLRTLLDEGLAPPALIDRLNLQIWRQMPRSRFITLFLGVLDPATGRLLFVNAGQTPPLLRRVSGAFERLTTGGIALGLQGSTTYSARETILAPGDALVLYSDGITEAENPDNAAFDETGLERTLNSVPDATAPDVGAAILRAVETHARDVRFADDLTVLVVRRLPPVPVC
jgi:phosphoserine phosphatase RsbU/P